MKTKSIAEKAAFDFIRYANCWEDAAILLEGLSLEKGRKIVSIGSAGDNSFSLLTTHPELVVAVDINKAQLYLIELKKAAFLKLDYEDLLRFLGFSSCKDRVTLFSKMKDELSTEALEYWKGNIDKIDEGIVHTGKFERYFQLFCTKILPLIHSKKSIEELFAPKTAVEQELFYQKKWNTFRWRLLFKLFFSKYVMGKYGRDKAFLEEVKVPVGRFIFNQAEQQLKSIQAQQNFILRYNLKGSFDDLLPHYLQKENYKLIKENLGKLKIEYGLLEVAFEKYGTFDAMNLSNIFEYLDEKTFVALANTIVENLSLDGKLAYWNLMVDRDVSKVLKSDKLVSHCELAENLKQKDKGFFYKNFVLNQLMR